MIKILISIVILLLIAYIGYGIEKFFKNRLNIIKDYEEFIRFTERETEFLKTNIEDIVNKYKFRENELKNILISAVASKEEIESKYLNESTKIEIKTFIDEISRADYKSIKVLISRAKLRCEGLVKHAEKETIQKGELARKLVILAGVGLVIVII